MLIQHKYDYKPLERIDTGSGRRYIVGETKPLPSVTTILGKTSDKKHLLEWRKRVGDIEATRITTEAAGLGTGMHDNLENYVLGKKMSGNFMQLALANVIIKHGLSNVSEVWGTEVALYSKELYAGTTDLIGLHYGIPSIIDYKNSIKEKKRAWIEAYFMQLAAYALSHNEMYGTDINRGVIMIATRDAKYQEFVIEGDEFIHYETMWANKVCSYYERFGNE